jgi:hypothetical protein
MTNAVSHLNRLEHDLRFILRHLQIVEGNFETVDELSVAAHSALCTLDEIKLDAQLASDPETEFEVPAPREREAADLADAALLAARHPAKLRVGAAS